MSDADPVTMSWDAGDAQSLSAILADGDIWLSQKTLSSLFGVTVANINIHVTDLRMIREAVIERQFNVDQVEGARRVSRSVKHYSFDTAYAIGIRGQRFEAIGALHKLAVQSGMAEKVPRIAEVKERAFGHLLMGALSGIATVLPQHHVPPYFIDFYIPDFSLAIEYGERHHNSRNQSEKDLEREKLLSKQLGVQFIRVPAGKEIEGLNHILRCIFGPSQHFS